MTDNHFPRSAVWLWRCCAVFLIAFWSWIIGSVALDVAAWIAG